MTGEYRVRLEIFEGPIDLLLYLIRKNHFEIFDIPISTITEQYLQYLDLMKNLNLDIAGEFLKMAASLMEIKSKTLLPVEEEKSEETADPRSELVQRLLEYQRFKDAAERLSEKSQLGWHTFTRKGAPAGSEPSEEVIEVSIFELLDAFKKILEKFPSEMVQEISRDKITVAQKIDEVVEKLKNSDRLRFMDLFQDAGQLQEIIATFLALLELIRLKLLKVVQLEELEKDYRK